MSTIPPPGKNSIIRLAVVCTTWWSREENRITPGNFISPLLRAVMDSISQLRGRRTLLMVTHHPALADACQEIYRMEGKGFVKVR